jgi:hypothetical protein
VPTPESSGLISTSLPSMIALFRPMVLPSEPLPAFDFSLIN